MIGALLKLCSKTLRLKLCRSPLALEQPSQTDVTLSLTGEDHDLCEVGVFTLKRSEAWLPSNPMFLCMYTRNILGVSLFSDLCLAIFMTSPVPLQFYKMSRLKGCIPKVRMGLKLKRVEHYQIHTIS
ncbi:Uncharacterized protein TCM_034578 [Theobroma cacao]|uniref:Uncharacterized protein n=1 Tax=Theobroma cacao TaxID=3641 RepID=A0A061FF76_THECC|nr:Uncharacterized protein TCM_034578 [Theobroma cacao]